MLYWVLIDEDNDSKSYFYETVKYSYMMNGETNYINYWTFLILIMNFELYQNINSYNRINICWVSKMPYNDYYIQILEFVNLKLILKNDFPNINFQDTKYENIFETSVHWNELPNL